MNLPALQTNHPMFQPTRGQGEGPDSYKLTIFFSLEYLLNPEEDPDSADLLFEWHALSPTCNEIPHKHTANPSQLRGVTLSPIRNAAKSSVDTSWEKKQNKSILMLCNCFTDGLVNKDRVEVWTLLNHNNDLQIHFNLYWIDCTPKTRYLMFKLINSVLYLITSTFIPKCRLLG